MGAFLDGAAGPPLPPPLPCRKGSAMGRNLCGHPREVLLHLHLASLSRDPRLGLGVGRGRLQTVDICSVQQLASGGLMLRDPWVGCSPAALELDMSTPHSLLHARGLRRTCCPRTLPLGQGSAPKTASEQRLTASKRSWIIRVGSRDDGDRPAPPPAPGKLENQESRWCSLL